MGTYKYIWLGSARVYAIGRSEILVMCVDTWLIHQTSLNISANRRTTNDDISPERRALQSERFGIRYIPQPYRALTFLSFMNSAQNAMR